MDCGPTCLRMVAKYYGRSLSLEYIRNKSGFGKQGTSMLGLAATAESLGLKAKGVKIDFDELIHDCPLPAIIHWQRNQHFVVLTPGSTKSKLIIADPASGLVTLSREEFLHNWISIPPSSGHTVEAGKGLVLLFENTPAFKETNVGGVIESRQGKIDGQYLFEYIKQQKTAFFKILLCLLIGSGLQLIFPYLTQSIVDTGINTRNIGFIKIILAAQLMLLFSQSVVDFIRSRILLHVSTKINISLLSNFWAKLLKLPLQFFDSKHPGDIIQRIGDHHRIENFLTGTALNTFFSLFTLIIFSVVLFSYHVTIFIIFAAGSILYLLWIWFFLKYRRRLDYRRFAIAAKENNATMQLVFGMQEIKLNNAEDTYRHAWESLQAGLFKLNFKSLSLTQYQQMGL